MLHKNCSKTTISREMKKNKMIISISILWFFLTLMWNLLGIFFHFICLHELSYYSSQNVKVNQKKLFFCNLSNRVFGENFGLNIVIHNLEESQSQWWVQSFFYYFNCQLFFTLESELLVKKLLQNHNLQCFDQKILFWTIISPLSTTRFCIRLLLNGVKKLAHYFHVINWMFSVSSSAWPSTELQ